MRELCILFIALMILILSASVYCVVLDSEIKTNYLNKQIVKKDSIIKCRELTIQEQQIIINQYKPRE